MKLYIDEQVNPNRIKEVESDYKERGIEQIIPEDSSLALYLEADGLYLKNDELALKGDFTELIPRIKKSAISNEMLLKAALLKDKNKATLFDATAGMGEDSFILAAGGFTVDLYEQDPVICMLLEDTVLRALDYPETAAIAMRMHVHYGDSIVAMESLDESPDVILLDPMFPERSKSALIKKKFQLLQKLEKPCDMETELMNAAMKLHPKKIVIKRPLKGPYLCNKKPSYSLSGKAVRYDCIINV